MLCTLTHFSVPLPVSAFPSRQAAMLPAIQPTHEALISALVQGKLWLRRLQRRWLRESTSKRDKPSRQVLFDDGAGEHDPYEATQSTSSKYRRRSPAALPARLPDTPPLPTNVLVAILFVASLVVRGWDIAFPGSVVFDEVHFLRFVKGYYYGQYFFDIHPPLGKLVLLVVTKLFCGPPHLKYDLNGEHFGDQIYTPLRWTSALFGSTLAPLSYLICRELGLSVPASFVPATTYVFEHLAVVESRLILLDAQLMCFMASCLLFALKLWGARKGTPERKRYLILTALTGAAAIGVKWTALATPALVALVSIFGKPFPRQGRLKWGEMGLAGSIAFVVYVALFYIHFWLLPNSGQGDAFMRNEFQRTLIGAKQYVEGYQGPGFVRNFLYLNKVMYTANAHIKTRHRWESKWYQWVINQRGLLYFNELEENTSFMRKIYLIVNPAVTVVSLASILAFLVIVFAIYLPKKWAGELHPNSRLPGFAARGAFLFAGYVVNILPYVGRYSHPVTLIKDS